MFIRYNESLDFWEYDSSTEQTGAGPWIKLPIDAAKLNNFGIWQDVPYAASNFYGSTGTWTVTAANVARNRYTVIGKTIIWFFNLASTVVAGGPNVLNIKTPSGIRVVGGANGVAFNYASEPAVINTNGDAVSISLVMYSTFPWPAATNVMGTYIGELE